MNIKRAFLAAVAVLMVPGLAMAQSSVTFTTSVSPVEAGSPDLTLTCNGGLPLTQTAPAGTTFTVTEINVGDMCSLVLAGDLDSGWMTDTVCDFTMDDMNDSWDCAIAAEAVPYDYYVTVDWELSEDADEGIGADAYVVINCWGDTSTYTMYPAGPGVTIPSPAVSDVVPPSTCSADLEGFGSAVEVDGCSDSSFTIGGGDQSCAISASAFYEGIPTLSQYGMAIMALLMLGVGFVGFRRFV